jgi:hypothetical protein
MERSDVPIFLTYTLSVSDVPITTPPKSMLDGDTENIGSTPFPVTNNESGEV